MQRSGTLYTLVFATVVCAVCSVFVSGARVALGARQERNVLLDRQKNVLAVSGLIKPEESLSADEIQKRFEDNLSLRFIDLQTGQYVEEGVPTGYDPVKATTDPALSGPAPANAAGVTRLPKYAVVYHVMKEGKVDQVILQVWGQGLWSTLYGYLALDTDCNTIRGLTFYSHAETPGLGGEVDNPRWKALWPGRKAYDESGQPAIKVIKGAAGPVEEAPHEVDGLSGATITGRGVESLLNFWLGDHGYRSYLDSFRQQQT